MLPENYTLMDASIEIALMLLAAFLLGWLFCWLMKKLFGKKQTDEIEYSADAEMPDLTSSADRPVKTGLSASSRERLYDPEVGIPRVDADIDIPTVNTPEVKVTPPSASVARPRIDLPDLDRPNLDLEGKLDTGLSAGKGVLDKGAGIAAAGLGSLAAGAVALKGQIGDKVNDIDLPDASLPTMDTPDIDAPEVELPDINVPEIDLPSAELPDVELPEAELPDVKVPEIDLPSAELPDVELPDVDLPDASIPDVDLSGKLDAGVEMGKDALGKGAGIAAAGLGSIAAGAAALTGKVGDAIDEAELKTPSVETPVVDLADGELPDVDVQTPDIDLPDTERPDINLSEVELADSNIPDVDLPDTELPDVNTADIELPDMETPDLSDTLDAGLEKSKDTLGKGAGIAAAGLGSIAAGAMSLKDKAADKVDDIKETLNAPDLPKTTVSHSGSASSPVTTPHSGDDLTRITGINDKVVNVLNTHGVTTYADLEKLDRTTLKRFLNETDDASLHVTEPASWPHQARLCSEHNWSKLREYQDFLSGNRPELTEQTSDEEESSAPAHDNLKKIEGIGPFFERTLNEAGITTFAQLKNTDRDTLKAIIDAAGPEYHSHEPETWPYQAGLADRGEWKKLKDYIHFMTGRS